MASRWSDIFEREPEREPELGPSHEPGPQPDSWFADKVEDVLPMQATQAPQPEADQEVIGSTRRTSRRRSGRR